MAGMLLGAGRTVWLLAVRGVAGANWSIAAGEGGAH